MNPKRALPLLFVFGTLFVLAFLLSACGTMDDAAVINTRPPMAQPEMIPVIMDPQAEIWRPGYWALSSHEFVWVPGRVIPRPDPTAVWSGAHWVWHTYGWSFEQGHWD